MRVTDAARASRASRTIFFHFIIACGERTRFIPRRPPLTTKHRVRPAVREGGLFARGSAAVPWGGGRFKAHPVIGLGNYGGTPCCARSSQQLPNAVNNLLQFLFRVVNPNLGPPAFAARCQPREPGDGVIRRHRGRGYRGVKEGGSSVVGGCWGWGRTT